MYTSKESNPKYTLQQHSSKEWYVVMNLHLHLEESDFLDHMLPSFGGYHEPILLKNQNPATCPSLKNQMAPMV